MSHSRHSHRNDDYTAVEKGLIGLAITLIVLTVLTIIGGVWVNAAIGGMSEDVANATFATGITFGVLGLLTAIPAGIILVSHEEGGY